jgi:hypothetical protein
MYCSHNQCSRSEHDNYLLEFESNSKRLFISFVIAKNRDFDEKFLPITSLFG